LAFDPWDIAFGSALMNDYSVARHPAQQQQSGTTYLRNPANKAPKTCKLYVAVVREISFANARR